MNSLETELRKFIDEIASKVAKLTPIDLASNLLIKIDLGWLSQRFSEVAGLRHVEDFYRDCEPKGVSGSFHLTLPLARLIPSYCRVLPSRQVILDTEPLFSCLSLLADSIQSGRFDYSICLRITNIDIDHDFDLTNGIRFQKLSQAELQSKYPVERHFMPISGMSERHILNHRVEVVITGNGTLAELRHRTRLEHSEALVNSILHTFLFANVPASGCPSVTHVYVGSSVESQCLLRGIGGLTFTPVLLTTDDISLLQNTYNFLADAENDRVLLNAIDRYLLGMKQGNHHPNRINEPNWDKIVDYTIALETLFLTVDSNPIAQESAYRFRINGSSLISRATDEELSRSFHALKHLYEIRSTIVHGGDESKILKAANKFIEQLQIERTDYQHSLGRFSLVCKKVESWLTKVLLYLGGIPVTERPYRKRDGWEELLWRE